MKRFWKKAVCLCLILMMTVSVCSVSGFATEKVTDNESVDGLRGITGNAVMVSDPTDASNKALKLSGNVTMPFKNDMGIDVSYTGNILVSARFYAQTGSSLTMKAGAASAAVTGKGKWETVSVLINTVSGNYETYLDNGYQTGGNGTANTPITGVSFETTNEFYVDDIKAEQFDAVYASDRLETVFEDNFDSLNDGNLYGQNGWSSNGVGYPGYGSVSAAASAADGGKGVDFTRASDNKGTKRTLHTFAAQTGSLVLSMKLKTNADTDEKIENGKLSIRLRQGSSGNADSGDRASDIAVQKHRVVIDSKAIGYQNVTKQGEWFSLKLILDAESRTYNIYVNDKKINPAPIAYEENPESLSTLIFEMNEGSAAGTWYVDDVKLEKVLDSKTEYVTVANETFDDGFSIHAIDSATTANQWKYGSRNRNNAANAAYAAKTAEEAGITSGSYNEGNALEVKALTIGNGDQATDGSEGFKLDTGTRSEAIVLHLNEAIQNNVRITADIYAKNYFYKNGSSDTRRDNLKLFWTKDYTFKTDANQPEGGGTSKYVSMTNGYVAANTGAGWSQDAMTYTQNAWNHMVIDIDQSGAMTFNINGKKYTNRGTSDIEFNDFGLYVPDGPGGWWYVDNIKIEKAQEEAFHTDVNSGSRTKLIENNIDEMYNGRAADTNAFTISGVYYTKDFGKSEETLPRSDASYELNRVELVKNADVSGARLIAAKYGEDKLESAVIKEIADSTAVGETVSISLLSDSIACAPSDDLRIYLWTQDGLLPLTNPYKVQETAAKKLFVASDSLAAPYGKNYPQKGWGEVIGNYLYQTDIRVVNYAGGGRSSKSFYQEDGKWNALLAEAKEGDFVLISFGHNDSKYDDELKTDPYGDITSDASYKYWLNQYAKDCEAKKLNMILVSPIPRRTLKNDAISTDLQLEPYVVAMREFAAEKNLMMVDLNRAGEEYLANKGVDGSKELYLIFDPATLKDDPAFAESGYNSAYNSNYARDYANVIQADGTIMDNTHLNAKGAELVAKAIAAGLNRFAAIRSYVK